MLFCRHGASAKDLEDAYTSMQSKLIEKMTLILVFNDWIMAKDRNDKK